jgi:hypothetical protein
MDTPYKNVFPNLDDGRIGSWADLEDETVNEYAMKKGGLFTFNLTEFKVLDEFSYDETIQRPETIRFYTLDEQIGDAYEKMIPKGRTTKKQMEVLKGEAERLRDLYQKHIVPTSDAYELRKTEYGKQFSWIHPVYSTARLSTYSYDQSWSPLYSAERVRLPQFYRSMMTSLPKPYQTEIEGVPYLFDTPTQFVNSEGKEPIRALPTFYYPRTQRHEDGRFDILSVPMANTADTIRFVGYYANKRPVPVPNPLEGHTFFASSDAVMIEETVPLSDIVPDLDTILTHGVPVTPDPYGEGMKYLRVYDVELSDIPWDSWKSRFPPAEALQAQPEPEAINFPKPRGDKPSENLMKYYEPYYPGLSSRKWLLDQVDGGELVIHMLLSQAGENGTVAMMPGSDAEFEYPDTTIEECELEGLDFNTFRIKGICRRIWGAKDKITYKTIPLELLRQERKREGYRFRKQWLETTPSLILESYVKSLVSARPVGFKTINEPKIPSIPVQEISQLRREVVSVLGDSERFAEDKLRDITDLIRGSLLSDKVYTDSKGLFLVCSHTLALLNGDLATDRREFYDTWTAKVDGFRVCKSCGEHINSDVLEEQEEFTDDGRLIRHADALQVKTFDGHGVADHVKTLSGLKELFDFSKPSDEVFFMLVSLLHVIPEVDQLQPILEMGRKVSAQLEKAKLDGGVAGIAQIVLLIQSHNPPLVPRRSFGSKPLTLRGYPRDAAKPEGYTIVDSMMLVLSKTLEAYPTSFKGSSVTTMRNVLNKPAKTKNLVEKTIDTLMKGSEPLRASLERAKAVLTPEEPMKPSTMIPGDLVMPSKDTFGKIVSPPKCPSLRVYWTSGRPPKLKQPDVPLRAGINHFEKEGSIETKLIDEAVSERVTPKSVDVKSAEVKARLKLGKDGVSEDWHTNVLIATRLASAFGVPSPIRTIDPGQKNDDLRDITKGYVYELAKEISKDPLTKTKLDGMKKNDLALMMLTADVKKAAEVTNTLKAKERITFTERFRMMTDADREITKELVDRGLAPYIITKQDRVLFAREVAEQQEEKDEEVGVGRPIDYEEQGELPINQDLVERGNYGDYSNAANNDGRDPEDAHTFQEEDLGI